MSGVPPVRFPSLVETTRLRMRSWAPPDAPALARVLAASDAHLRAWTPWVVDGRTAGLTLADRLGEHERAFQENREWVYGLFTMDEASILGACGLYARVGAGGLELGYWLAKEATGQGYATEAAGALTRLALATPGIEFVEARVEPANRASVAVAERLGFTPLVETVADTSAAPGAVQRWQLRRAED
jgi:ribosomal-protein-serine acetyltransferase